MTESTTPRQHPDTAEQAIAAWAETGYLPIPTRSGSTQELQIKLLIECSRVNGLPLDLVIEGRVSKRAPPKRFGVIFSDSEPAADYPLPVLWIGGGLGTWLASE